jgi:acetolactate synthase-1/2/3 large subunit
LRDGLNVAEIVDRSLGVAMTEPRGPVYLTLPREILAQRKDACVTGQTFVQPTSAHPDPAVVERLAQALATATFPAIVCTSSGADPRTVPLLVELANRFGIGVAENRPRYLCFPSSNELHLGSDMSTLLPQADALLFLETDVPWIPAVVEPRADAFVAQAGSDPSFVRYPVRSFRADVSITSNPVALLGALIQALAAMGAERTAPPRRDRMKTFAAAGRARLAAAAAKDAEGGGAITKLFMSRCLDEVRPQDAIVVNEYSAMRDQMRFDEPGTFFQLPSSGGLGWGLPAALGAQQAAPDRVVISVVGDGAYLFANPAACHQAAAMHELPVLVIVYNNEGWEAVEKATTAMYPKAHTENYAKAHRAAPLSSLQPIPDFELYAKASGGHGERVERREDLVPALKRALAIVRDERRQVVLNVIGR